MSEPVESIPLNLLGAANALVQVALRLAQGRWSAVSVVAGQPVPLEEVHAWSVPADRIRLTAALEVAAALGTPWQGECETRPESGLPRWLGVRIVGLPAEDDQSRCLVLGQDITRQKLAEQHQAELIEHWALVSAATGMGTIVYDVLERVVRMDELASRHHGLPTQGPDGLPIDMWLSQLSELDRLKAHALLNSEPTPGQTDTLTVRVSGTDGGRQKVLELAFRCSEDGQRLVGSCRDVTQERTIEEMRRKKLAAERASKAKSEFMSQVSHELRTPLNGILGFAQVMIMDQEQPLPLEHHKRAEMVLYSGRRLLTLIDQLLEISRIEQGRHPLQVRSVNVASVVKRSMDQVQPLADQAGISMEMVIDRPEKVAMRADPGALEQILVNLLSNAIKYNRQRGRVRVRFDLGEVPALVVEDTGRGISESEIGRLFEPFNRLSAQRSGVQGYGLGLVITRRLVEAMGGQLRVASKVGVGTQFWVTLPMASQSRFDASRSLPLSLPSRWDSEEANNVLYIEDDEVNVLLMEQLFSTQPAWKLHVATTGRDGLQMAVQRRPDVILLDMNLPDMTGQEVFRLLRKDMRTANMLCVAVSADAMPSQVRRALSEGMDDYWMKPLDLSSVVSKLKTLLREAQIRRSEA